jgi:hypothetical protein
MSFYWVTPPEKQLVPNIEEYGRKAEAAVYAVAKYWGQLVQDDARVNAVWEDRTGNARSGLFYGVDGFGFGEVVGTVSNAAKQLMKEIEIEQGNATTLVITLAHTVFYGKFLELSNGGRYAVIMSTLEQNLPSLERMVKEIF